MGFRDGFFYLGWSFWKSFIKKAYFQDDDEDGNSLEMVPITLVLCVIAVYVGIGSLLFGYWNNWSFIKGAYFSFVTLSTVGESGCQVVSQVVAQVVCQSVR